ncbi:hypothetical protein LSCM1_05279 [Leishmania martiniquensis]|uniref:Uncharacterized protein n=1 Tax=Leishmania martiniquensis TaxID=1580590 RepID=A0A836KJW1_9TRYP|nr:hypothetical protein LSCM1_05279 [Leishmania martiniquensis]
MGQQASSVRPNPSNAEVVDAAAEHGIARCAGWTEPPVFEMQNMLCTPSFCPSASGAELGRATCPQSAAGAGGSASSAATTISVLCLETSAQNADQLCKSLVLPPTQRARALQEVSKNVSGVLWHAPVTTSVRALRQFLLEQTALPAPADTTRGGALALHLFAIRDPLRCPDDAADGASSCGSAEASFDLLLALPETMELSTLSADRQLFFFPAVGACAAGCDPITRDHTRASTADSNFAALQHKDVDAEAAACPVTDADGVSSAGRALVLLYSREENFGFDGDDMLLITCCLSICACIAASICCCASAAKNSQALNVADSKPNHTNGGNGVPSYNNGSATAYYGYPSQQEYYSGAPGYGVPPNAYTNSNQNPLYRPQPQPNYYGGTSQYQPHHPQVNGIPMQPATCTRSAPATVPL